MLINYATCLRELIVKFL